MNTELIEYNDGETLLEAFVAMPDGESQRPVVLVAHDWSGRRQFAMDAAERIAKMGYIGFALDMYGKGVFGADGDVAGNSALMNPFASDRALLRQRVGAALTAARAIPQAQTDQMAAIGYCFGGMCVLELARSGADVRGVVSIHGILAAGETPNASILSKVLCLHGHDDPMVPPEQVLAFQTEMSEAGVDWQLHSYGKTMHAFTNPAANNPDFGTVYSEEAQRRAYQALANFLEEIF